MMDLELFELQIENGYSSHFFHINYKDDTGLCVKTVRVAVICFNELEIIKKCGIDSVGGYKDNEKVPNSFITKLQNYQKMREL
jgi:hypothetical protein